MSTTAVFVALIRVHTDLVSSEVDQGPRNREGSINRVLAVARLHVAFGSALDFDEDSASRAMRAHPSRTLYDAVSRRSNALGH